MAGTMAAGTSMGAGMGPGTATGTAPAPTERRPLATTDAVIEDAAGGRFPTRHGMARLVPVRAGRDERIVFVVERIDGTRIAGPAAATPSHDPVRPAYGDTPRPVLGNDGPRRLLGESGLFPHGLEERLRQAFATGRRHELLVRRAGSTYALELIPDRSGVTALWSERTAGEQPARADGDAAALAAGATVDGDTVGCVVLRAERRADGELIDLTCELSVASDDYAELVPPSGSTLADRLPATSRAATLAAMAQMLDSQRPFRPPRGLFGSDAVDSRCDVRASAFADRAVVWLRTRPHTRSVVDLREREAVSLTRREREILALLAEGASTTEIARTLYLSTNTVRNHVRRLLSHLGASSRLEAVVIAAKTGLLELRRETES